MQKIYKKTLPIWIVIHCIQAGEMRVEENIERVWYQNNLTHCWQHTQNIQNIALELFEMVNLTHRINGEKYSTAVTKSYKFRM